MSTKIKALEALENLKRRDDKGDEWDIVENYLQSLPDKPLEDGYYWATFKGEKPRCIIRVFTVDQDRQDCWWDQTRCPIDEFENFVPVPGEEK